MSHSFGEPITDEEAEALVELEVLSPADPCTAYEVLAAYRLGREHARRSERPPLPCKVCGSIAGRKICGGCGTVRPVDAR